MARENAVVCPHCTRGPFVDLLQHACPVQGTVHDEEHLELALRLVREGRAAKSAMIARFGKEVSDDDGDGNTARDGRGAEQGDGENREGYEGRAEGFSGCVGRLKPTVGLDQTPLAG